MDGCVFPQDTESCTTIVRICFFWLCFEISFAPTRWGRECQKKTNSRDHNFNYPWILPSPLHKRQDRTDGLNFTKAECKTCAALPPSCQVGERIRNLSRQLAKCLTPLRRNHLILALPDVRIHHSWPLLSRVLSISIAYEVILQPLISSRLFLSQPSALSLQPCGYFVLRAYLFELRLV